jgi:uncharacterized phage protein (predicted DNA packaging)
VSVSLESLKAHLNITGDADDAMLTEKLAAAAEWVAKYTGIPSDADDMPAPVGEAVRRLAADLYENRESSLVGATVQTLPFGMLDLLEPYREWCF